MSRFRVCHPGLRSLLLLSVIIVFMLGLAPVAVGQTWTGNTSNSMKNSNNWSPTTTPANGDDLTFPAVPNDLTPDADFTSRRTFNTFTFGDGAYTMTGDGMGITGGMTFNNTTNPISINLTTGTTSNLAGSQNWTLNGAAVSWLGAFNLSTFNLTVTGSGNLTIGGTVSGTGAI